MASGPVNLQVVLMTGPCAMVARSKNEFSSGRPPYGCGTESEPLSLGTKRLGDAWWFCSTREGDLTSVYVIVACVIRRVVASPVLVVGRHTTTPNAPDAILRI